MTTPHFFCFLPCASGIEALLAQEVGRILPTSQPEARRRGVMVNTSWEGVLRLNLYSRLAQRVLIRLSHGSYQNERDLYELASNQSFEDWFGIHNSFKVEATAQHSPLKSLRFAALTVKDAIADRFRHTQDGQRPSVDTWQPDVRIYLHLDKQQAYLYLDTSGEALFKRGWRDNSSSAPLKETLAAALLGLAEWQEGMNGALPFYDPFCGSGTLPIEAAQIACNIAPGNLRRFGFEKLRPYLDKPCLWQDLQDEAQAAEKPCPVPIFGSDISHRIVDFAKQNALRAGVAQAIQWRGGNALERLPPAAPGIMIMNPPYGERLHIQGSAFNLRNTNHNKARTLIQSRQHFHPQFESASIENKMKDEPFFSQLTHHWKQHYGGWTAWILSPDLKLPSQLHLQASRRIPLWNGPIECRLFRFNLQTGSYQP